MHQNLTSPLVRVGNKCYSKAVLTSSLKIMDSLIRAKHGTERFESKPLIIFYQNFMHLTSNISLTLGYFSSFKQRFSMCVIFTKNHNSYGIFCNLNSKPQQGIPNCKWESMSESHISLSVKNGKYRFNLFITPNVRDILFAIFEQ